MDFLHFLLAISALVSWSSAQDCTQYTKNDCLFKHITGCSDPSACTKGSDSSSSGSQADSSGTSADTSSNSACFHGDEYVLTEQHGRMKMSDLAGKPSINVQSRDDQGRMVFSPIYYWLHSEANAENDFIILETEHGQTLSLTEEHLIYRTNCRGRRMDAVFASRIQPGHCLMVVAPNQPDRFVESRVERRTISRKYGLYAPITEQGNLVVNDVLASCFTSLENEALQKIMYRYMDGAYRLIKSLASSSVAGIFYSMPFAETVQVPEVVFSFWDLSKKFMDQ